VIFRQKCINVYRKRNANVGGIHLSSIYYLIKLITIKNKGKSEI